MRRSTRYLTVLGAAVAALAFVAPAGAGSPPVVHFEASPSPSYGSVAVGMSLERTYTLRNTGGTASASLKASVTPSTAFTIPAGGDRCSATSLGPRKACTVTVRYTPAAEGASDTALLRVVAKRGAIDARLTLTGSSMISPLAACQQELAAAGYAAPENPNYVLGTAGDDDLRSQMTAGNDVVCGFAGRDTIGQGSASTVDPSGGDIVLGGEGADHVFYMRAVFEGGPGNDSVDYLGLGTFNGGDGDDFTLITLGGTFNGGAGDDSTSTHYGGTFNGGADDDTTAELFGGTFNGGDGDDYVGVLAGNFVPATFNGEAGCDAYGTIGTAGTFNPGDQSSC